MMDWSWTEVTYPTIIITKLTTSMKYGCPFGHSIQTGNRLWLMWVNYVTILLNAPPKAAKTEWFSVDPGHVGR